MQPKKNYKAKIDKVRRHTIYLYARNERDLFDLLAAGFADNKQEAIRRALSEAASNIRRYRHR